jgi:hypothetical protein
MQKCKQRLLLARFGERLWAEVEGARAVVGPTSIFRASRTSHSQDSSARLAQVPRTRSMTTRERSTSTRSIAAPLLSAINTSAFWRGIAQAGREFDEHAAQLAGALRGQSEHEDRQRRFLHAFVRPRGLDQPATPVFADAVEDLAGAVRTAAGTGRV